MSIFDEFKHQYSVQKTLRFELKPVGKTSDYLGEFLEIDKERADHYKVVKSLIDEMHREYIEDRLSVPADRGTGELMLSPADFEDAYVCFRDFKKSGKDAETQKKWKDTQKDLREKLVKMFSDKKDLFEKKLITEILPEWLKERGDWEEHKGAIESFGKFTTYFTGFHENRENMYSHKEQKTAIAYRLMNENLPTFFTNCLNYEKIKREYTDLPLQPDDKDILKKMGVKTLDDVFQPGYFVNLFTQSGIECYKELLGGRTNEDGSTIEGINQKINLYRQKRDLKARKLPGFTRLYNQILSKHDTPSFVLDAFGSDKDFLCFLKQYIEEAMASDGLIVELQGAMKNLTGVDAERVYVKGDGLRFISSQMFDDYGTISNAIWRYAEKVEHPVPANGKESPALIAKREKYTKQAIFSIAQVDVMLSYYRKEVADARPLTKDLKSLPDPQRPILSYLTGALDNAAKVKVDLDKAVEQVKPLLELESLSKKRIAPKNEKESGSEGYQQIQKIQEMLDAFMALSRAVKPLHLVKGNKAMDIPNVDDSFYADFSYSFKKYDRLTFAMYNKTRNHLTKKPFSTDKIKVNFDVPTLLAGWDVNKEPDNATVLFERDGLYYLGIMPPKHRNLFNYTKKIDDFDNKAKSHKKDQLWKKISGSTPVDYRKVVYKLLPGANKMLPKVFFSNTRKDFFAPSAEIMRIYNTASHSKNGVPKPGHSKADFNLQDCHKVIDFFKESILKHPEWREFDFKFSDTSKYEDLSGFYGEVGSQGYRIKFDCIKSNYVDQCVEEGKLLLFQIYNKDFSSYSRGKPNLHTIYWKGLFEPKNLDDVVLKLNGEAEAFFRQHSVKSDDVVVHPANTPIQNKNTGNPKKTSVFAYDITKDKRYTQDKYMFHVPITLNFKAGDTTSAKFNAKVNRKLANTKDIHIIGIDRGERHLLYFTVINRSGEIVGQGSLNEIDTDQSYKVNYHEKLDDREKIRDKARKSWSTVENIKDLKSGYLSHVVHKLAKLMVEYDAIVCLEDLNFGFKRGRFRFEKQVYQKFEKALIDKLNYLVFKDVETGKSGSHLNAYQLTAPFQSFEKLRKQSGFLFYVPAAYTSQIDPVTGFVNFIRPKYESLAKSKTFFECLDSISFNVQKDYFEFHLDYEKMSINQDLSGYQNKWVVCTQGDVRYHPRKVKCVWEISSVNVTAELKKLLTDAKIQYADGGELKDAIASYKNTKFYKTLFWLLSITLKLRHSKRETSEDFILSPVANAKGEFFDSRRVIDDRFPKDADANGAYHIALKGLWNLERIAEWDGEGHVNLAMKNNDWFQFAFKLTQGR